MISYDIFKDVALSQVPRILGLEDREADSKTYGCFDRYYWHYWLLDTSNARMQESVLLLALLFKGKFEGNAFFENNRIYDWCIAGVDYCRKIQHKDGSFDEIYPNEQSFCATSFASCALAETFIVLDEAVIIEEYLHIVEKNAQWLARNNNSNVINQMAEAAACLSFVYRLTGKDIYKNAAMEKIYFIQKHQDQSGYLPEYGGWDIGYQSISIASLHKILRLGIDSKANMIVSDVISRAIGFMAGKIDNDGTYSNSGSSRNTQYIFPSGFVNSESNIIDCLKQGLEKQKVLNPAWMDDRYCISLTIDYLQTYLRGQ